jgi:hypothetical protein
MLSSLQHSHQARTLHHSINSVSQSHLAIGRSTSSRRHEQQHHLLLPAAAPVRQAGPPTQEPDYADIDGQPLNKIVMALFRNKMVAALGSDSQLSG